MDPAKTPLLEALQILRMRVRTIGALTFAVTVAGAAYALLAPKWYQTEISVVGNSPQKNATSGLAALTDLPLDLNIGNSDAERIQAILRSRSVTDAVIEKFKLLERYGDAYIEAARESLWQHCSTKLDKKPGVVTVTCEDKDPQVVQQMTEYFGEFGNTVFRRVSASSAHEERVFLEQRVTDAKKDVEAASQKLREFEEQHKLIDLSEQSKAVVSAIASLEGDLLSKQMQLSYLNSFSAPDEATAAQVRQQISLVQSKLKSLEENGGEAAPTNSTTAKRAQRQPGIFPAAASVPELRYELMGLYRQQKIQETLFLLLTQRYEMAKVNEARDTSAFQIVDHAALPQHKSRPKRVVIIVECFILGLFLSACWAMYASGIRKSWTELARATTPDRS
jgi:capsule polysaccharide export protein KpsE/RkpR